MKKITLIISIIIAAGLTNSHAQNTWTQKANFYGATIQAVGFSIGSKGYIGTGSTFNGNKNDFWEYDPATDAWTQKANFGGTGRWGAIGFSIGEKGYIGTGYDTYYKKDFWEYDPTTNTWIQKADLGGPGRTGAVGFSIGTKGYVGTGSNSGGLADFWEYDPTSNKWKQRSDFEGTARVGAVGFSIGSKGYVGTGDPGSQYTIANDFWEYDPATNAWIQKANFGGEGTHEAVGFSIGNKGYIGTGYSPLIYSDSFWEYDPSTDAWLQKANVGGAGREKAVGFSIGGKGYCGIGGDYSNVTKNDFWEYTPVCNGFTVYADADGDGYGDYANNYFVADCIVPSGYAIDNTDCNDTNASINPGATEVVNGIDENCNGIMDDVDFCALPVNLTVVKITGTTAKLKWNAVAGAEGYSVRYKALNTSAWKYGTTYNNSKPIGGLIPNTIYKWEIQTFCQLAPNVMSDWSPKEEFTTGLFHLSDESPEQISFQIYPNPAEDHATIQFSVGVSSDTLPPHSGPSGQSSHVSIKVYDMSGKEIGTLLDNDMEQGDHSLLINTNQLSKGVYLVKMISPAVLRDGIVSGTPYVENQKLIVQ